jgi:hypothetical protein
VCLFALPVFGLCGVKKSEPRAREWVPSYRENSQVLNEVDREASMVLYVARRGISFGGKEFR